MRWAGVVCVFFIAGCTTTREITITARPPDTMITVDNGLQKGMGQLTATIKFKNDTDVHLVTDRMTGKSRGFAFVTMSSAAEGKAAIAALEGKNLDGRNLTVNEARPKDEGAKRSFTKSRW